MTLFIPLSLAYFVLVSFYAVWCYIGPSGLVLNIADIGQNNLHDIGGSIAAKYFTSASFLILAMVSVLVFLFSIYSVWVRNKMHSKSNIYVTYFLPLGIIFSLSFLTFTFLMKCCSGTIHPLNSIGRSIFENTLGGSLYPTLKLYLSVADSLSFLAVSAIFTAVCTLEPNLTWELEQEDGLYIDCRRTRKAVSQVASQFKWLKTYLLFSSALLLFGVIFLKMWTTWPLSYFSSKNVNNAKIFEETVNAIVAFEACLYVLLLVVVFIPVTFRLMHAGSLIAKIEMRESSEEKRRNWMALNGLSLSLSDTIQSVLAILSPFLPIFFN